MMTERTSSLLWGVIGLFVGTAVGAATLFGVHLVSTGGGPFVAEHRFWALFPSSFGVVGGTRVRVNGIEAGEVFAVEITTTDAGEPVVAVGIALRDADRFAPHVRTTSKITIGAANLIGEKVVEITAAADGEPIPEGAHVPGDPPFDLGEALDRAAGIVTDLSKAVDPEEGGADLRRTLRDLQISAENLREITNQVKRFLPR